MRLDDAFLDHIERIYAELRREYEKALETRSRPDVGKVDSKLEEFEVFFQLVDDLLNNKSGSIEMLAHCGKNESGVPVYSLVCGRWRGLFHADTSKNECIGITVEKLSPLAIAVEKMQHPFRKRLR